MAYLYAGDKDALLARLHRIEGQIRGIARMVEEDRYCVDILNQISAVGRGLEKVGVRLLSTHIRGCVRDAVAGPDGDEKVDELVEVVEHFLKA